MRQCATWFLILGIGAFILPMVGLQFKIFRLFGESLPLVAGGMVIAGMLMLGLSFRQGIAARGQ